jgi:hypothetical protein
MGVPWVLSSPEQVEAFRRDWDLGLTLAELAALHGYKNPASASHAARRLGLPKRRGGRPPGSGGGGAGVALRGGRWARGRHGVYRWVPDGEAA